jgi:AraC-like DNA-binding protein
VLKSNFYRKSLIIVMIITCIPTAMIGLFVHLFGVSHIEREVNQTHQIRMKYATERIYTDFNHIETKLASTVTNFNAMKALSDLDLQLDVKEVTDIYRLLTTLKWSAPVIDDIFLYIGKDHALVNDNEGVVPISERSERTAYDALLTDIRNIYWTHMLPPIGKARNSNPISLVLRLPGSLPSSAGALIVLLKEDNLNMLLNELAPESTGSALLWTKEGTVISAGKHSAEQLSELDRAVMNTIPNESNMSQTGSFILAHKHLSYSVSYGSMIRLGNEWRFASATPIAELTRPITLISNWIIGISAAGLLVALVLSYLASRELYRPLNSLVQFLRTGKGKVEGSGEFAYIAEEWSSLSKESESLHQQLDIQLPQLRESFLLQLLQGRFDWMREEEMLERLHAYGWERGTGLFGLMVIELHGLSEDDGGFSVGDEQLVTFAAANIAAEIARNRLKHVDVINFQDMSVGLLLRLPLSEPAEEVRQTQEQLAEDLNNGLHSILKIGVTVCIGLATHSISSISNLMEETRIAMKYKQWGEDQQILKMDELLPQGPHSIIYPFETEKQILQLLRIGAAVELDEMLDLFYNELAEAAATELQIRHGLQLLLGNMLNMIVHSGFHPLELYQGHLPMEQFVALSEPKIMLRWLKEKLILPYIEMMQQMQDFEIKRLVENVLAIIHSSYQTDLSLEACADQYRTYPKKLSMAFKKVTGSTFIDYLTQFRLEHAKKLLRETDERINDIGEQVGYQPQYFNRIFKKHENLTPGQYRELHKEPES